MKRIGNLYEKFISKENWLMAAAKAIYGKKKSRAIVKFIAKGDAYVMQLRQQVIDGTFEFKGYRQKVIYEPKKRLIYVARVEERVLHWALMLVLEPIYEKRFIYDSYSCRHNKGQHKASQRVMQYIQKANWCLKCDIRKFYPSVNQEKLKEYICTKIKDRQYLRWLFAVIDSYKDINTGTGVPIGNYCSQILGNIYMSIMDYFCKHTLKCKKYVRYCDDFLLFAECKETLKRWRDEIYRKVAEMKFTLSKCELFKVSCGIDFVGYRHFRNYILLRKRSKKNFTAKIKKIWCRDRFTDRDLSVVSSVMGWLKHCNSYNLREKMKLEVLDAGIRFWRFGAEKRI